MNKVIFFVIIFTHNFAFFTSAASEGEPVIDEDLFRTISERYDGSWATHLRAKASSEILRDNSILIEVSDDMAEFFFYNLNRATEDIMYIPSVTNERYSAAWLNYFNRISDDIACGLSSFDLKRDPFPIFKCRFRVDSAGDLHYFFDRTAETSRVSPPYDGEWETGQRDFHWRAVNEQKSEASVDSTAPIRNDSVSFSFGVYGEVASSLYHRLDVEPEEEYWGPFPVKRKVGQQISCVNYEDVPDLPFGEPGGYECHINFAPEGTSVQNN